MRNYANLVGGLVNFNTPLFRNAVTGLPASRQEVLAKLDQTLLLAGLEPQHYSGHSFRKGGAQSLREAGVELEMIKAIGRWASDCYKLYIQQPAEALRAASLAMDTANLPYHQVI